MNRLFTTPQPEVKVQLLREHFHNGMRKKPGQILKLPGKAAMFLVDRRVGVIIN